MHYNSSPIHTLNLAAENRGERTKNKLTEVSNLVSYRPFIIALLGKYIKIRSDLVYTEI